MEQYKDNIRSLQILTEKLDEFLQKFTIFYLNEDIAQTANAENTQFKELLECTDRLQDILEKLEDTKIKEILDPTDVIRPTQDQYLASILGFSEELVEYLEENDNYYSNEQLVLDFLEKKEEEVKEDEEFLSWEEAFKKLGFTEIKSKILGELADTNPFSSHETPAQWASRHIEQEFKYNTLLRTLKNENDWNKTNSIDIEYEIPTSVDEVPVFMKAMDKFKLTKKELYQDKFFTDYLRQDQNPIGGVTYWFHGTDHGSALSIIRDGIDVTKGNKELDFSDGAGFYLTR